MSAGGPDEGPLVQGALGSGRIPPRAVLAALLRSAGVVAVTLVVYAVIPIREETALAIGGIATIGLVVLGVVFIGQLRRISAAANPLGAAVEALALVFGMFLALFAFVYASMTALYPDSFTQPVDKVAAVYFSVTVLATVGFGDIAAVTELARVTVTVQMVLDLVLIGAAVKLLGASARRAVDARQVASANAGTAVAGAAQAPTSATPPMSEARTSVPEQWDQGPGGVT